MDKPQLLSRITVDPDQCGGRPCVRGLRIRVTDVLDLLANGLGALLGWHAAAHARALGGSLLVTSSARTPASPYSPL